MKDHSNEPTATEERAAANRGGAVIKPVAPDAPSDPDTGLPAGVHDGLSPIEDVMTSPGEKTDDPKPAR